MNAIRIIHAVPKMDREGLQSFLMNVYLNIDRKKVQFDFLVHNKEEGDFDSKILSLGGKIYRISRLTSIALLQYQKNIKNFFREHKYNVLHSHINLLSSFTLKAAKKAGVSHRIAHSHSSFIQDVGIKKIVKLYAKKSMNKYATHKMACSKDAAIWQFGKEAWGRGEVEVVPNGINIKNFLFQKEKRDVIRKRYNIKEDDFILGHVGSFRKVKNHPFILNVFSELHSIRKNSYLMLVGSGEEEEAIRLLGKKLNILDFIIFVGNIENVGDYYSSMDGFIFPSFYEGLGMALIEAQSAGLPSLASDVIPKEAILSDMCIPLSLSKSYKEWAMWFLTHNNTSRTPPPHIYTYDIEKIAKNMESFYLNIYENP